MSPPPRSKPLQIIVFSHPRTACHLLERMLSSQPDFINSFHVLNGRPIQVAMLREDSIEAGISDELRTQFQDKIDSGIETWRAALSESEEEGKSLFRHEHPHFSLKPDRALSYLHAEPTQQREKPENFTLIPDDLLLHPGTIPIFTIRHPALTVPAAYRAMNKFENSTNLSNLRIATPYTWIREFCSWYLAHEIFPIIVEAEDYMSSPELVKLLAENVGMSPVHCVFEWDAVDGGKKKGMDRMYVSLQQTLLKSRGVDLNKVRFDVDLGEEREKWKKEFGEEVAEMIGELAEETMEDWEWLRGRKLRVE